MFVVRAAERDEPRPDELPPEAIGVSGRAIIHGNDHEAARDQRAQPLRDEFGLQKNQTIKRLADQFDDQSVIISGVAIGIGRKKLDLSNLKKNLFEKLRRLASFVKPMSDKRE